jgi:hypothetical protein
MPSYVVWDDECESMDDAVDIIAMCERDAAEAWAEDAGAPGVFEGGRRIAVEAEDGTITKWLVVVKYDPNYTAIPAD